MYGKILRALGHLTGLMILISALWTAWNVVALIGTSNPLAYGVAIMFDGAWLVAVAVQHELRYRVDWRGRLSVTSWSLALLSSGVNACSELIGRHGVAVAVIAAVVPPLAKGCLQLKLMLEANSAEAKTRFSALTQSWADQVTELRISEAMSAQWHRVERVHENADARRLAATQADRLSNLELTSGSERPVTRVAEPVTWEPPVRSPLAPVFQEPVTEAADADVLRMVRDGASGGAPQVSGLPKSEAITVVARCLGPGASPAEIVQELAYQGVPTDAAYVRNVLHRVRKAEARAAQSEAERPEMSGGYL